MMKNFHSKRIMETLGKDIILLVRHTSYGYFKINFTDSKTMRIFAL